MPYNVNVQPPPSLTALSELIDKANGFQTLVMLNDIRYFDLPLSDPRTARVMAQAATLAEELKDDPNMLSIAKGFLHEFVGGQHAFAGASGWLTKPIPTGDEP